MILISGEGPQLKLVSETSEKTTLDMDNDIAQGYALISCGAAELVPTVQYGNVTLGPIIVKRFVPDDGDDQKLLGHIERTQAICETAVASHRDTVHNMIRQSEQGRAM